MRTSWAVTMMAWLVVGVGGLNVSLSLLLATRQAGKSPEVTHLRRLALARVLSFGFVAINAPIVYLMFDVPKGGDWTARVQTGLPFWAILVAAIIVIGANAGVLILTVSVLRDLKGRDAS